MSNPLGEYAMKAINGGMAVAKMMKFLKEDKDTVRGLELTRDEVEAVIMVIKEFSAKLTEAQATMTAIKERSAELMQQMR